MVPKQEGWATNQTEPNVKGIRDNPVSGSHPSVTGSKREGGPGRKAECGLTDSD